VRKERRESARSHTGGGEGESEKARKRDSEIGRTREGQGEKGRQKEGGQEGRDKSENVR